MASSGILLFIFTALCVTAVKSAGYVNVECITKNLGHYGQQSLLECVVQMSKDVTDPVIRVVAWKKWSSPGDEGGRIVLGYSKVEIEPMPGYRFAEPSWNEKNMNVSLLITNTAVTDEGLYSCMVITDSGDHTSFTALNVQAKYSAPTVHSAPEKIVSNTDSALMCESDGGYPEGKLRWFDGQNSDWTESSELEVKQHPSGLFQLTSTLYLLGGYTFSKYTCVVFNASGGKVDEITFEMPNLTPLLPLPPLSGHDPRLAERSKVVTLFVVIGSLIVGLLCVLLFYRRRSLQAQKLSATPLIVCHHAVHRRELDPKAGDQSPEKINQKCPSRSNKKSKTRVVLL